jgi:DNA-directed RNA polymerase subunit RPC12/RpoP
MVSGMYGLFQTRYGWDGVAMASWVLKCADCKREFTHSTIRDDGKVSDLLLVPMKPDFPPAGAEYACPHCARSATYQRNDLNYRA